MDAAEIARLWKINEKATQGEWTPRIHSPSLGGAHIRAEIHQCNIADIVEGTTSSMGEVTREDCVANATYIATFDPPTTRTLLDALEQARKEIECFMRLHSTASDQRDAALQDAKEARALAYEECAKIAEDPNDDLIFRVDRSRGSSIAAAIHARIEAMLEKKP